MSTRSNVGIKEGNKFKYIYVHFDGYPTGVGATLKKYYTDPAKVEKLISLGDCSVLGRDLDPERESFDDYNSKTLNENGSLFYGRDRGEKNVDAKTEDWDTYVKYRNEDVWIEFVYVFENGEWTGYRVHHEFDKSFNPMNGELIKVNEKEYGDA